MEPLSKHISQRRSYSVKYNTWTEGFGSGPKPAHREVQYSAALQQVDSLRKMYDDEDCFLSHIVLCSRDQGEVTTHRIILAVQSKYFQGVFRYEKKEKIDMNLSAETLCTVVRAMYPGRANLTRDNIYLNSQLTRK